MGMASPPQALPRFFEWLTTLGDKPSGNSTLEVHGVLSIKRNKTHHILTEGRSSVDVCLQKDVTQIVQTPLCFVSQEPSALRIGMPTSSRR